MGDAGRRPDGDRSPGAWSGTTAAPATSTSSPRRWPMIEQAAAVCSGAVGPSRAAPGSRSLQPDQLGGDLGPPLRGVPLLERRASSRASARRPAWPGCSTGPSPPTRWEALADRIWETGHPRTARRPRRGPGLIDHEHGRFLDARRLSTLRGLWTDQPELLIDRSTALDISMLGPVVPFGLLARVRPADGPHRRGHPRGTTRSAATRTC